MPIDHAAEHTFAQVSSNVTAHFMPRRIRRTIWSVADTQGKIRDFLIQEARRHPRKFLIGPHKRPNGAALARAMEVDQATVSRILNLSRNLRARRRRGDLPDFAVSPELELGLMRLASITSKSELWDAIENAPPAPAPDPSRSR